MAVYRRVDGFKSPAGWLPVHRDQLRAQRSVTNMGEHYLFYSVSVLLHSVVKYLSFLTSGNQGQSIAWTWILCDVKWCIVQFRSFVYLVLHISRRRSTSCRNTGNTTQEKWGSVLLLILNFYPCDTLLARYMLWPYVCPSMSVHQSHDGWASDYKNIAAQCLRDCSNLVMQKV